MEENVALDTSKQKKFVKSIKGIKKLLKKKQLASTEQQSEPVSVKPKFRQEKKRKPPRGLVYLSHIPHGFYEPQMTEYFRQFGTVTNVRVIRSKRTGRSKGHAFVEFKQPTVAEIVAETMNNYLMGKRLIKAAYIPPEKIRIHAKRKFWTTTHNPSSERRLRQKRICNSFKTEEDSLKQAKKILANLKKTKQKLSELGINYDFFQPVDIPDALIEIKIEKGEPEAIEGDTVVKTKSKKKGKKPIVKEEVVKEEANIETTELKIKKKNKKNKKVSSQNIKVNIKDDSKDVNLKKGNVKPLEEFIQVNNDSDNDDSSVEFDSDEFEKMLENDDSDSLSDDVEDLGSSNDEESVIDFPPKKVKRNPPVKTEKIHNKKAKHEKQKKNTSPQIKRKASSVATAAVTSKKPKFEKQIKQISTKKQFKKKK